MAKIRITGSSSLRKKLEGASRADKERIVGKAFKAFQREGNRRLWKALRVKNASERRKISDRLDRAKSKAVRAWIEGMDEDARERLEEEGLDLKQLAKRASVKIIGNVAKRDVRTVFAQFPVKTKKGSRMVWYRTKVEKRGKFKVRIKDGPAVTGKYVSRSISAAGTWARVQSVGIALGFAKRVKGKLIWEKGGLKRTRQADAILLSVPDHFKKRLYQKLMKGM